MYHHTLDRTPPRDTTQGKRPATTGLGAAARPPRPRMRLAACFAVLAVAALTSGCGGSSDASEKAAAKSSASPSKSMGGMSDMNMSYGDPKATPAYKMSGATAVKGVFKLLDTRPPGMDGVKGTAWLAQGAKGTTVTVSLTGLKAGHHYMAHLHAQHCSAADGGEHFQFTKGGAAKPPNEVWLTFTADKSGKGMTTVNNAKKTGEGAVALVVHPMEAMDNRIACADFDF
ncbi:superoxide dismutase family protein [Streptomyces canus]|uniref:superoxide dismutase family protein n=1 Tax=Streptomyces canus TaxID=58343 RepID=UPI00386FBC1F|nr:superoxide dismutase family protein [Streptomyces canus]